MEKCDIIISMISVISLISLIYPTIVVEYYYDITQLDIMPLTYFKPSSPAEFEYVNGTIQFRGS